MYIVHEHVNQLWVSSYMCIKGRKNNTSVYMHNQCTTKHLTENSQLTIHQRQIAFVMSLQLYNALVAMTTTTRDTTTFPVIVEDWHF